MAASGGLVDPDGFLWPDTLLTSPMRAALRSLWEGRCDAGTRPILQKWERDMKLAVRMGTPLRNPPQGVVAAQQGSQSGVLDPGAWGTRSGARGPRSRTQQQHGGGMAAGEPQPQPRGRQRGKQSWAALGVAPPPQVAGAGPVSTAHPTGGAQPAQPSGFRDVPADQASTPGSRNTTHRGGRRGHQQQRNRWGGYGNGDGSGNGGDPVRTSITPGSNGVSSASSSSSPFSVSTVSTANPGFGSVHPALPQQQQMLSTMGNSQSLAQSLAHGLHQFVGHPSTPSLHGAPPMAIAIPSGQGSVSTPGVFGNSGTQPPGAIPTILPVQSLQIPGTGNFAAGITPAPVAQSVQPHYSGVAVVPLQMQQPQYQIPVLQQPHSALAAAIPTDGPALAAHLGGMTLHTQTATVGHPGTIHPGMGWQTAPSAVAVVAIPSTVPGVPVTL
eukprot:TRINITY_DN65197_c0_g1_i1.p1 TRINITY_DN65197_c0_g1~~TRINITY_DN65197_c0_g1_i1.p1  ORF type:complete len:441 (+),score=1.70 TRINITY_DN65197_c0_g1_i1:136-1458(+)